MTEFMSLWLTSSLWGPYLKGDTTMISLLIKPLGESHNVTQCCQRRFQKGAEVVGAEVVGAEVVGAEVTINPSTYFSRVLGCV